MNGDISFETIDTYILECYSDNEIKRDQNHREAELLKEPSTNNRPVPAVVETETGESLLYLRCTSLTNHIEIHVWYSMAWLNLLLIKVLK